MNNLIDELHELNDEDFEVSASFSQDVMKKIKRGNVAKKAIKITSALSCACAIVIGIFVATKTGVADRVKNAIDQSIEEVQTGNSMADEQQVDFIEDNNVVVNEFKEEATASQEIYAPQAMKSPSVAIFDSTTEESVEENKERVQATNEAAVLQEDISMQESKKYSRVYDKSEYLLEISKALNSQNIKNTIINDEIEVYNSDINNIYNIVENFVDVELEFKDDIIIIKLTD